MTSRRAALIGLFCVAGCGFTPAYGPGGAARRWQDAVAVNAPSTAFGFRMRQRLVDTFGVADVPRYTLAVVSRTAPVAATVTEAGDITRINLTGNAQWSLTDIQTEAVVQEGLVQTFTSYSATGSTVATQAAEGDARDRLAAALADLIVQQMLTAP